MKTRTHWTISSLKDYEQCPAKYQWSYLFDAADWRAIGYTVVPDTGSPAMQRGTDVHLTCEDYLDGKITIDELHPVINQQWRFQLKGLKDVGAVSEEQWELDAGWFPVVHPDAGPLWLRMKLDAHYVIDKVTIGLVDFKTGKPYRANIEQVEVYALGAFAKFPAVEQVEGALWYFDSDEPHEKTFTREQAPQLARKWESRAGRLLGAKDYPPRESKLCGWCPYNALKGGPCLAPAGGAPRK